MAERDRSQGIGFVYTDISEILREQSRLMRDENRPIHADNVSSSDVVTLTKDKVEKRSDTTVDQIKQNLERLQSMHHKLHAILAEISDMTPTKNKK